MLNKIESIKSQLDELCDLYDGSFEGPGGISFPPVSKQFRLGQMILRLLDGDLEERYARRLFKWLEADRTCLNYYVEFIHLCIMLKMLYNQDKVFEIPEHIRGLVRH